MQPWPFVPQFWFLKFFGFEFCCFDFCRGWYLCLWRGCWQCILAWTKVQPAKGGFSCTHAHRTGLRSYCYATGQLNALVHLQKNNATIGQWQWQNMKLRLIRMLKILIWTSFFSPYFHNNNNFHNGFPSQLKSNVLYAEHAINQPCFVAVLIAPKLRVNYAHISAVNCAAVSNVCHFKWDQTINHPCR